MGDETFKVLDKFLKPIVTKEAWFYRNSNVTKELRTQKSTTALPLLSNEFIRTVNKDHDKDEQDKQDKRGKLDTQLRKTVLRPEKQSIKDFSASGLPQQGSLQVSFTQGPSVGSHSLCSGNEKLGIESFVDDVACLAPNSQTKDSSTFDRDIVFLSECEEDLSDISEDENQTDIERPASYSSTSVSHPSLGFIQANDVLKQSQQQLQENDESSAKIAIVKPEASISTLNEAKHLFNEADQIGKVKSSKDTASCTWTLKRFSKYIRLENFEFLDSVPIAIKFGMDIQLGEFNFLCDQLKQDLNIYCVTMGELDVEDASCFAYLHHTDTKESLIKLFMNHVIGLLCAKKKLKVHHEFSLGEKKKRKVDQQTLLQVGFDVFKISPRSDYILEHEGTIIGSVELKAPRYICKNSMVPLMLQLLKIQHYQQNPAARYIGILTDGYKYIVIFLRGNKFTFDTEKISDGKEIIKIHRAKKWSDIPMIMNMLCTAVEKCIKTTEGHECSADYVQIISPGHDDYVKASNYTGSERPGPSSQLKRKPAVAPSKQGGNIKKKKVCAALDPIEINSDLDDDDVLEL